MTSTDTRTSRKAMRIVKNLLGIGAYLHREGSRIVNEYGLNQQQFVILNEIVARDGVNQKQLVGELLYEKSNVSKIIKKLKHIGFIEVARSDQDKRMTILKATPKGRTISDRCVEKFNAWNLDWIRPLSETEIDDAIAMIMQLKSLHQS